MTTYTIVIARAEIERIARALLPAGGARLQAGDRVYRLYFSDDGDPGRNQEFRGLNGEILTEVRSFATEAEAKAWVAEEVVQRRALRNAVEEGRPS